MGEINEVKKDRKRDEGKKKTGQEEKLRIERKEKKKIMSA